MRKYLCILLIIVALAGCVASQKTARPEIFSSIHKIVIVPVEPPPLSLTPAIFDAWPDVSDDVHIANLYSPRAVGPLVLIGGIVVATKLPNAVKRRADVLKTLDEWYASDRAWVPTRVLGHEAANRISADRSYEVIVRQELHTPSSLVKREATWHMENWYAPLRKWYNQDRPALIPEEYNRQDIDAFLEIGILNYEFITGNKLSIQVLTKLVSVSSGKVEARNRSYAQVQLGTPEELFRNQGEQFKQILMSVGGRLLESNLRQIGMIP